MLGVLQARRQDSVTGGGTRSLFCLNSRGARGHEEFIPVWIKQTEEQKVKGIFRPKSEIQAVFPAENRWSPKKKGLYLKNVTKFGVSPQKNTNLDLDLRTRSPEPVNFFGAQSSLGGHNFRLGGTSSQLGGTRSPEPVNFFGAQSSLGGAQFSFGGHKQSVGGHGPGMPPVAPGLERCPKPPMASCGRICPYLMIVCLLLFLVFMRCTEYSGFGEVFKGGESPSQFRWFATAKIEQ